MSCEQTLELLDAYIDRELDLMTMLDLESHLNQCDDCRASYERYQQAHDLAKTRLPYFKAPEGLEDEFRSRIRFTEPHAQQVLRREWFASWRPWAIGAALAALIVFSSVLTLIVTRTPSSEILASQVVSSHVRSLMANHLVDIPSSDQHTVKPWFSGKLDFAPTVKDLSLQGFALIGGRLDYMDNRPVAALVYKRRQHAINLFVWPSPRSDSRPQVTSLRGYNVVHWNQSHMAYWAVSDINAHELREFIHDLDE
jgi:anti-sigma factor RsiW